MWKSKTPGIPDEEFERTESVPITKEEIRAIQISKGRLSAGQTVLDIGCGSGSVTVEAAIQIEDSGKVVGVDIDPNAIELTEKNLKKFGISNYTLIEGNAKEKISNCLTQILYSLEELVEIQKILLNYVKKKSKLVDE